MYDSLDKAIQIAVNAHHGQIDKAGEPYILHPLRVMLAQRDTQSRIVAVLHDVVEDSSITLEYLLHEGFSDEIIDAVDSVTKRNGEAYDHFLMRCKANDIGRKVKIADLRDNMDLTRIQEPSEADYARVAKYREALKYLTE